MDAVHMGTTSCSTWRSTWGNIGLTLTLTLTLNVEEHMEQYRWENLNGTRVITTENKKGLLLAGSCCTCPCTYVSTPSWH